jgi:hypothetical protein
MGGGFSVKNNRVLPALNAPGVLVVATRLALFISVVIAFLALLRLTSHRGLLTILIYLLAGLVCTGYCSGRLLEQLWICSGSMSVKLWSRSKSLQEYVEAMRQAELQRSAFELGDMTPAQREAGKALLREVTHG